MMDKQPPDADSGSPSAQTAAMIRVVLADDHPIIRDGLRRFFDMAGGIRVVAEAGDGHETIAAVSRGGFDVLVLDMTMPGPSGFELIELIRTREPSLPILVLSIHNAPLIVRHALEVGASGYVTKDSECVELAAAIHRVAQGGTYLSPDLAGRVGIADYAAPSDPVRDKFSEVDFEILRLMGEGRSSRDIALSLCIDEEAARAYVTRLRKFLA